MGDRTSIQFQNNGWNGESEKSVALFHHWGGTKFPKLALKYAKELKESFATQDKRVSTPMSRLEPRVVMVNFIYWLGKKKLVLEQEYKDGAFVSIDRITDSIYLGTDAGDGDNSDNGNWIIDLDKLTLKQG